MWVYFAGVAIVGKGFYPHPHAHTPTHPHTHPLYAEGYLVLQPRDMVPPQQLVHHSHGGPVPGQAAGQRQGLQAVAQNSTCVSCVHMHVMRTHVSDACTCV